MNQKNINIINPSMLVLLGLVSVPVLAQPASAPLAQSTSATLAQPAPVITGNQFNPAISVIFDGVYSRDNVDGEGFSDIPGFTGGHAHDDGIGNGQGFGLRETEITISATVDPYFDAFFTLAIVSDGAVDLEEAYLLTRALPYGLQAKFGKFLSDVGYINNKHPHNWYFVDRPLVNELLFGDHGLQDTGVQLTWLAPTAVYSRFGIEGLQGDNEGVANHLGEQAALGGTERILKTVDGPRLLTAFAKFAPNLGHDHALQAGFFGGHSRSHQYSEAHSTRYEDHDGSAWFAGTDWVYKYDAGRAYGHGNLIVQAEYMYRERDLERRDVQFAPDDAGRSIGDVRNEESFKQKHDGAYLQVVYGFAPRWNAGFRLDTVGMTNKTGRGGTTTSFDSTQRYTAAVTFLPTEFSRLRLQFSRGEVAGDDDDGHGHNQVNQLLLQYQFSLGAHGAHQF